MRRIDPRHRTIGQFFQDEIATPLGIDAYIRIPHEFRATTQKLIRKLLNRMPPEQR